MQPEKRLDQAPLTVNPAPPKSEYMLRREKMIADLMVIASQADEYQYGKDQVSGVPEKLEGALIRDPLGEPVVQYRTMREVDEIYSRAKKGFGRELSIEEEEKLLVTLDYVFKRIVNTKVTKDAVQTKMRGKQAFLNMRRSLLVDVLPGNDDTTSSHDLVHVVLAIKQGVLNDNSPVPTFMQTEEKFSTAQQAMLDEAFASIFTSIDDTNPDYDKVLKEPSIPISLAKTFSSEGNPREELPQPPSSMGEEEKQEFYICVDTFIRHNAKHEHTKDPYTCLVLFSQLASLNENFIEDFSQERPSREHIAFIKQQVIFAQENIDALLTGIVSEGKDEKYKKTVEITREAFNQASQSLQDYPDKPVFVELLLNTLAPLYAKAKAQQDATLARLASVKYDLH